MIKKFPFYRQLDAMDCSAACLKMIAAYHGKVYSLELIKEKSRLTRHGASMRGLIEAAEYFGFRTIGAKIPFHPSQEKRRESTVFDVPLPFIAHWNRSHYVVVYRINKKFVWIADPARGKLKISHQDFKDAWLIDDNVGIALILEPTPEFYKRNREEELDKKSFRFLLNYLIPYKNLIVQLLLGLVVLSLFQLVLPFLTQSIVDIGILNQNINFIYLILVGQLMVFLGNISVGIIQGWIVLHMSTRINISLTADFLTKLMKLPIGFFDAKVTGDLLQRISDHSRIDSFLTNFLLTILVSIINLVVFGIVLFIYNANIFYVFLVSSILYILWIVFFLKKRKEIDYERFAELSDNQSVLIELIQGMQEIKLQNSEDKRKWKWMNVQSRLFFANVKSLALTQYQDVGAGSINQLKDILISFIAATAVIHGEITLGMMLAIQYIVGQLNVPLQRIIQFVRSAQDAQIALERLGEIHNKPEENQDTLIDNIPDRASLYLENVSFRYNASQNFVLDDVNLIIPNGKVTAIVGTSGSGKTTLIKLLLGFYEPTHGKITLEGKTNLKHVVKSLWRSKCGVVMQNGFLFSDTIGNNITESDHTTDQERMFQAVELANIQEFIESLPKNYDTVIGAKGNDVSQGQRQRILIARAIYKNPDYLFFDEATNALDSKNERIIVNNLKTVFAGRTVVVVAHRLSTVKNADQIIVLEEGKVKEMGNHTELTKKEGLYYSLVKDQLELGNS